MDAAHGVEEFWCHGAEITVNIARMIQDDDADTLHSPHGGEKMLPTSQCMVGRWCLWMDGEDVEMAYRCGDLVPYDRGEVFCHAHGLRGRTIIGVVIVIGGHRQLNALTGNAEHGLFQCGIPMSTEGSCVDVGIGCNPSTGVHLTLKGTFYFQRISSSNHQRLTMHPVLETTAGIQPVGARCQSEMGLAMTSVNNTRSKSQ